MPDFSVDGKFSSVFPGTQINHTFSPGSNPALTLMEHIASVEELSFIMMWFIEQVNATVCSGHSHYDGSNDSSGVRSSVATDGR